MSKFKTFWMILLKHIQLNSIITWGDSAQGGDSSSVAADLKNVTQV